MRAGKDLLKGLSSREAMIFMQLTQLPALLTTMLGMAAQFPAFSTVISNVPGPRQQLFWNGARLDGIYPASIVFDGFAMNITLVSYARSLDFGIVACRRSLPEIQRMIDYLEEALVELEEVAGLRSAGGKKSAAKLRAKKPAVAMKSAVQKPAAKKSGASKPVVKKPVVKKPVVKKPVVKKPAVKKPAVKKPVVKKPAVKKPAAKKVVTKKTATKRPVTTSRATVKPKLTRK
jgi:diacylglycerol O-acyltransferase